MRGKKYKNLVNLFHIMSCDKDMKAIEQESSLELTEVRAGGINLESNIERDLESNPWRSGEGKDQAKKTEVLSKEMGRKSEEHGILEVI